MAPVSPPRPVPAADDPPWAAGLRFLVELAAWVAGPWAVAAELGRWALVPTLALLVALPAVFSTPGDKKQVVVPTPGPVRLAIEVLLHLAAVVGAWMVWPTAAAVAVTLISGAAWSAGFERARRLLGVPRVQPDA